MGWRISREYLYLAFILSILLSVVSGCAGRHDGPGDLTPQSQATGMNVEAVSAFNLVNQERIKAGLPALVVNDTCIAMTQAHSEDMVARNYFSHDSPTETFSQRASRWGLSGAIVGENIAAYPSASGAVQGWMNSPGHRANILNPKYVSSGMGFYQGYYTQCFYGK